MRYSNVSRAALDSSDEVVEMPSFWSSIPDVEYLIIELGDFLIAAPADYEKCLIQDTDRA